MTHRLWFALLVDALLAVASGVSSNLLFGFSRAESFIVGLVFFVGGELFVVLLEAKTTRSDREVLVSAARALDARTPFSRFVLTLLLDRFQSGTTDTDRDGISIGREDVPRLWTECITHCEISVVATSYVALDSWWEKSYSRLSAELRKAKAQQGKTIRTLFLWETADELRRLAAKAADQRAAGITVAHFPFSGLGSDPRRAARIKTIGTPDFAILEGKWAFLHYLDKKRNTTGALLTSSERIVSACKDLIELTPGEPDFEKVGSGT